MRGPRGTVGLERPKASPRPPGGLPWKPLGDLPVPWPPGSDWHLHAVRHHHGTLAVGIILRLGTFRGPGKCSVRAGVWLLPCGFQ